MIISLIYYFIRGYIFILFIYAILSWFPTMRQSSFANFIERLAEPYLSIFDRIPTRIGIFDFKIYLAVISLLAIQRFLFIFF
ncbi:MAG: YggT family protein [Lactovum sp.]